MTQSITTPPGDLEAVKRKQQATWASASRIRLFPTWGLWPESW